MPFVLSGSQKIDPAYSTAPEGNPHRIQTPGLWKNVSRHFTPWLFEPLKIAGNGEDGRKTDSKKQQR